MAVAIIGWSAAFQLYAADTAIDSTILHVIKEEAVPAWRRAQQLTANIQVKMDTTQTDVHEVGGKSTKRVMPLTYNYTWDADRKRRLVEYFGDNSTVTRRVVVNPKYRFSISQLAPSGPWIVNSASADASGALWEFGPFEDVYRLYVEAGYTVVGIPLEELLGGDPFHLERVVRVPNSGDEQGLVEIAARYTGKSSDIGKQGSLYAAKLNPHNQWMVVSASRKDADVAEHTEILETVSYRLTDDGVAFPKELRVEARFYGNGHLDDFVTDVIKFSVPGRSSRADEEFYLEHYGLSEAVLSRSRSWFILVLNGVIILLCLVFWIWHRRRKQST